MPKSEKLPAFADWTPPWGTDPDDFDSDKAARRIYDLLSDKEKLQSKVDSTTTRLTEANTELEKVRKDLTEVEAKGADEKLAAAQARVAELENKVKAAESTALKYEVALDEGLTKVQAKRLIGDNVEELTADAEELLESFGGRAAKKDDEDDEDEVVLDRVPRRLQNGSDPGGPAELSQADIDKAVLAMGGGSFI